MEAVPKIRQNLDTNLLKLVAIVCMVADHAGKVFLPDNMPLAILGRIAFPLFAYCIVVGCLYTRDMKKYMLRLAAFALISQPFFVLAFHPTWEGFVENILVVNIFFTLIAGVLAVSALMDIKKRWWMLPIAVSMELLLGLDYGFYGIGLMVIIYLFRGRSWLSALIAAAWMIWQGGLGDFLYIGPLGLDLQAFALLALPLIYVRTDLNPKVHKYFFYVFYPAHFLVIFVLRLVLRA